MDLGKINSSVADSLTGLYISHLRQKDLLVDRVSPSFLDRNWPSQTEWSTKAVRDVFFASPIYPRLTNQEAVKKVIADGVSSGTFAYVGKSQDGGYDPVCYQQPLSPDEVEITDDMFLVKDPKSKNTVLKTIAVTPAIVRIQPDEEVQFNAEGVDKEGQNISLERLEWSSTGGTVDAQGLFRAGQQEGTFKVTVSAGMVQGAATVDIVRELPSKPVRLVVSPNEVVLGRGGSHAFTVKGYDPEGREIPLSRVLWSAEGGSIDERGFFQSGQEEGSFDVSASYGDLKSTAKAIIKGVNAVWSGEVPHQRWSQFYNRVLMRHVMGKKLKLKVDVRLEDVTAEDVEQMRIALQELGLDDDVQAT